MTNRTRQPAGQPTGGQFAPQALSRADVSLAVGGTRHISEHRGITATVDTSPTGMRQLTLRGHDESATVDAWVDRDLPTYPEDLPGDITGMRIGLAKHHDGRAVTFHWEGDDGDFRSITMEDVGSSSETWFQLNEDMSDLPPMSVEQRDRFDEWSSEAADSVNSTIEAVEYEAAAAHREAAARALTQMISKQGGGGK